MTLSILPSCAQGRKFDTRIPGSGCISQVDCQNTLFCSSCLWFYLCYILFLTHLFHFCHLITYLQVIYNDVLYRGSTFCHCYPAAAIPLVIATLPIYWPSVLCNYSLPPPSVASLCGAFGAELHSPAPIITSLCTAFGRYHCDQSPALTLTFALFQDPPHYIISSSIHLPQAATPLPSTTCRRFLRCIWYWASFITAGFPIM